MIRTYMWTSFPQWDITTINKKTFVFAFSAFFAFLKK